MSAATSKENAILKLQDELKKAKEKHFAQPIISYLIKRCEEDNGLCEDVCQEHKTWEKCFSYIYKQAKKFAKGANQCAVRSDVVFEWAEDYYHKDDKAEKEEKARKEAERKPKEVKKEETKTSKVANIEKNTEVAKVEKPKAPVKETPVKKNEEKKPKKNSKAKSKNNCEEMEGQLDLFTLLGM